jgi:DNA-directed RNA polymerase specialized sigma24 family protein
MAKNTSPINEIPNTALSHLIDEWIKSERDRAILKRRLIDGRCYEPLAEDFDLSVRQVKNIVYKAEQVLYKHM